MRSDIVALCVHVSIATLAELQRSEVVLFTNRTLATSTRNLPSKTSVAIVAEASRARLSLEIERVLLEVREEVHILPKNVFVETIDFAFPDVIHRP